MQISRVNAFSDNYIWILINPDQESCLCIDPGDARPVLDFLTRHELNLDAVFLTHHHFDHQGGVEALLKAYPSIKVFGPADTRMPLVNEVVADGDKLPFYNWNFDILAIPGHTSTHIAYHEPRKHWVFCGDTLFAAGCGRVFDGTLEQLYTSLQRLAALPDETEVYCAHEYTLKNLQFAHGVEPGNRDIEKFIQHIVKKKPDCTLPSRIDHEKKINPFLRLQEKGVTEYAGQYGSATIPQAVFRILRAQKDKF